MSKLIEVKDLKKQFENGDVITKILHGVTFDIDKGEFVSIMGPSGSGKSTLMHILGFLDVLSEGQFLFEGRDVSKLSDDELADMRSKKIGFVFQAFNLLNRSTTLENVMLPLLYTDMPKKERVERAKDLLNQVGLGHRLDYSPNKLSGGEKQRVAIARALVNKPDIILTDLMMPDMNGFDFLKQYAGEKGILDIPVIVLSNLGQESDKVQCKAFVIKEYLVKTEVDIDTILQKAESYL